MHKRFWLFALALLVGLEGCAAHSPFIFKNTTDSEAYSQTPAQAHSNKVLFLDSSLPEGVKFEVLGEINAGRIWYGGTDSVLNQMAEKARELGADAVIEIGTWYQPSGFAWAAPHGTGKAIRILNKGSVDLSKLGGQWR